MWGDILKGLVESAVDGGGDSLVRRLLPGVLGVESVNESPEAPVPANATVDRVLAGRRNDLHINDR
jgi:hypothetical protein